jgi:hypothetical protein
MLRRPRIRRGDDLYEELRESTQSWRGLQRFLDDLRNNMTPAEIESRRVNYARLRREINVEARAIYRTLDRDQKLALSRDGNLVYPGLARYSPHRILVFILLDQVEMFAAFSMFWESTPLFPATVAHHTEC